MFEMFSGDGMKMFILLTANENGSRLKIAKSGDKLVQWGVAMSRECHKSLDKKIFYPCMDLLIIR